ncbi:MAG TPA: amidohydrolase family protein [Gemmataceae bacterium]|jgi:predicted TIM-barrel fold metal-dependent hydrolase|nr:amidohydrolase family protein [Gemmataceae bacterium]
MNRRQFLAQGAAAVAGAAVLGVARAEEQHVTSKPAVLPIIDTHQHLWDLSKFKLPWVKKGTLLARSFLMADYKKATAGLNVVKTVYMEVDVDPAQQQQEADYVLGVCKKGDTPMAAAVISGRPASDGFAKYITPFKGSRFIKGVRQVLHGQGTPAGYCLAKSFIRGVRLLGELGLSFDLCVRPGELADAARLVDACPDTRFILDHCGNANVQVRDRSVWKRAMAALARRKNIVCKVSGIVASAKPGKWTADDLAPIVKHTVTVFGHDRVMFGGDWPVCTLAATYKQWVEALRAIVHDWKEEERRKLFHGNAQRFYGLA